MKKATISIFILASISAFAQPETPIKGNSAEEIQSLKVNIETLQKRNSNLTSKMNSFEQELARYKSTIDGLKNRLDSTEKTSNQLGNKLSDTEKSTAHKIEQVDKSLDEKSLHGIIGIVSAILISGVLYWLLSKRQKIDKIEVVERLQSAKASIEESLVKEFGKQTSMIEDELQLLLQQKAESTKSTNTEPDHSLALKLASEINLIERNINLMDKETKGLKQLGRSVGKLKDNLLINGYEIPELLGKRFHQGMKVIVSSSIPDENLEKDSEIISKVLIPQVNFNGKMIQTAQIEVSVGI